MHAMYSDVVPTPSAAASSSTSSASSPSPPSAAPSVLSSPLSQSSSHLTRAELLVRACTLHVTEIEAAVASACSSKISSSRNGNSGGQQQPTPQSAQKGGWWRRLLGSSDPTDTTTSPTKTTTTTTTTTSTMTMTTPSLATAAAATTTTTIAVATATASSMVTGAAGADQGGWASGNGTVTHVSNTHHLNVTPVKNLLSSSSSSSFSSLSPSIISSSSQSTHVFGTAMLTPISSSSAAGSGSGAGAGGGGAATRGIFHHNPTHPLAYDNSNGNANSVGTDGGGGVTDNRYSAGALSTFSLISQHPLEYDLAVDDDPGTVDTTLGQRNRRSPPSISEATVRQIAGVSLETLVSQSSDLQLKVVDDHFK